MLHRDDRVLFAERTNELLLEARLTPLGGGSRSESER